MTWTPFPGAVPAPLAVVGDRTGGIWAAGVPGLSEPRAIGGHTATLVTAAVCGAWPYHPRDIWHASLRLLTLAPSHTRTPLRLLYFADNRRSQRHTIPRHC